MSRTKILVICCTCACMLLWQLICEGSQYKLRVLDSPAGKGYSAALRINDQGVVAGLAALNYNDRNNATAFYWDTSGVHPTGAKVSGYLTVGLNNAGTIVCGSKVWSNGSTTTLPVLFTPGGNTLTDVSDDTGAIVSGSYVDTAGNKHAVVWDSTGTHDLGTLDGHTSSMAFGINNLGQVVGKSWTDHGMAPERGVLWENGNKTQLDPLGDYDFSLAVKINNRGQVVGTSSKWVSYYQSGYESQYLRQEATLWNNGVAFDIAVDGMSTYASDINDSGQVVGCAFSYPYAAQYRAFVWQDGAMMFLDDLGGAAAIPSGINANGWIAGQAYGTDGQWHAVVWEPVPEPSSLLVFVSGLAGLGWARRRLIG